MLSNLYEGYRHISEVTKETNKYIEQIRAGNLKPLLTSSPKEQDNIGGYYPSMQVVIAARSGQGKTARIIQDIKDFCDPILNPYYKDKVIVLFDTWEMPGWRNVLRMYSSGLEKTVNSILNFKTPLEEEYYERLLSLSKELDHYPIYFNQITENVNVWSARKHKIIKDNPDYQFVVVVDHTRLVSKSKERTEEELITSFMKAGMELKNSTGAITIFLSQLNRNIETAAKSREDIGKSLVVASDIFGADSVMQCADIVLTMHRPGYYGLEFFEKIPTGKSKLDPTKEDDLMLLSVLKQRDGWTGTIVQKHELKYNRIWDYPTTELPSR